MIWKYSFLPNISFYSENLIHISVNDLCLDILLDFLSCCKSLKRIQRRPNFLFFWNITCSRYSFCVKVRLEIYCLKKMKSPRILAPMGKYFSLSLPENLLGKLLLAERREKIYKCDWKSGSSKSILSSVSTN